MTLSLTTRVAILDDDPFVLGAFSRNLRHAGYQVFSTSDAGDLLRRVEQDEVDVVVSDLLMPGIDGLAVLRRISERAPTVPVILISGAPSLDSAISAISARAFAMLRKPCSPSELKTAVANAAEEARSRREIAALRLRRQQSEERSVTRELELARENAALDAALDALFMVYQPIVRHSTRRLVGFEALVRSRHAELGNPARLFEAAETLGRVEALSRRIRAVVGKPFESTPNDWWLFVNVLPPDLHDDTFLSPEHSSLVEVAERVVLEVSESARSEESRGALSRFRERGMRIAIDDLGAGYAGLNSIVELEPEVIKLDMVLVRDVHQHAVRQRLVRALVAAAIELNVTVVAEGVETPEELSCLLELGCDIFQGWYFGKPAPELVVPEFVA